MKKPIILLAVLLTGQTGFAQFGLRLGLNFANQKNEVKYSGEFSGDSDKETYRSLAGPMLTFYYDATIDDNSSFEIGLGYVQRGFKVIDDSEKSVTKAKLSYLYFPVTYKYAYEISDGMKLFGRGGVYLGFGLSGKLVEKYKDDNETSTNTVTHLFGNDEEKNLFKPFDFGMEIGGGLTFNNFEVGIGYDLGLANISVIPKGENFKHIVKNRGFFLMVGMRF